MRFFLTAIIASTFVSSISAQRPPMNPVDVVGVESCGECHEEMVDAWRASAHAISFETLISSVKAEKMADKLDINPGEIAMRASCVRCHYTQESIGSMPQPTEAVSCESCHGEGFKWIDEHYKKSISRSQRIERSGELGMIHPANVYEMSATCYECHVIDDEQLVNQGGHPAMSEGFEILSWYSGEVAHNYLVQEPGKATKVHAPKKQPIPAAKKRMLYLSGKLQHMAATLRAIARAKDPPVDREGNFIALDNGNYTFAVQHAVELKKLEGDMKRVLKQVSISQYTKALAVIRGLNMKTGHGREMESAALQISRLAESLSDSHSGQEFGAIDPILENLKPRYSGGYVAVLKALEIEKLAEKQPRGAGTSDNSENGTDNPDVDFAGGEEFSSEVEERMEETVTDEADASDSSNGE